MRAYWTERHSKKACVYSLRMGGVLLAQFVEAQGQYLAIDTLGPFGSNGRAFYAGVDRQGPWVMERPYVRL